MGNWYLTGLSPFAGCMEKKLASLYHTIRKSKFKMNGKTYICILGKWEDFKTESKQRTYKRDATIS